MFIYPDTAQPGVLAENLPNGEAWITKNRERLWDIAREETKATAQADLETEALKGLASLDALKDRLDALEDNFFALKAACEAAFQAVEERFADVSPAGTLPASGMSGRKLTA